MTALPRAIGELSQHSSAEHNEGATGQLGREGPNPAGMNNVIASLAALALVATTPSLQTGATGTHEIAPRSQEPSLGAQREEPTPFRSFRESFRPPVQDQVHIEQRVIIRIAPSPPSSLEDRFARLPRADAPVRYREKKFDSCVPIDAIAGVEPVRDDRLLLFMRDHRVLSAALEDACDAEAFYLGFYVERSPDGMLCKKRDRLQSRTGATCTITEFSRLVAVKD